MTSAHFIANVRRFLDLESAEKSLLLAAWGQLLAMSLRLRWRPRRTLAAALSAGRRTTSGREPTRELAHRLADAIGRAAGHHLWPMTCLPRALALQRMLATRGIPARIRIGVRKEAAVLAAHSWVEIDGVPLGEPEAVEERFRALLPAG